MILFWDIDGVLLPFGCGGQRVAPAAAALSEWAARSGIEQRILSCWQCSGESALDTIRLSRFLLAVPPPDDWFKAMRPGFGRAVAEPWSLDRGKSPPLYKRHLRGERFVWIEDDMGFVRPEHERALDRHIVHVNSRRGVTRQVVARVQRLFHEQEQRQ